MLANALTAWTSAAVAGAGAAFVLLAAWVVGFSLLPLSARAWSGRVSAPLALSIGALAVGWTVWVVGWVLGTTAAAVAAALMVAQALRVAPLFWRRVRAWWVYLTRLARSSPVMCSAVGLVVTVVAIQAALPVVDSDGLRYHLALPKLFLLEGRISFYPYDVSGGLPQAGEMLYLLGLQLGRGEIAKWLHALFFLASVCLLVMTVHRGRSSRGPAWVAGLAFVASPVVLAPAGAAFVDHTALFHVGVAIWLATRGRRRWIGLPLAAAAVTKLTAAPALAVVALAAWVEQKRGRRLQTAGLILVPVLVAWLPFAVRNLAATGDPVFPVGHGLLGLQIPGIAEGGAEAATHFSAGVGGYLGLAWGDALAVRSDEVLGWHHLIGLVALAFVRRARGGRALAGVVAAYALVGLWLSPATRLLLPAVWALAACEGIALARLRRSAWLWVAAAVCVPAALSAGRLAATCFAPWRLLGGELTREEYLGATVPGYRAARVASQQAGGGRIMALDFPAPFYLDSPWIAEGILEDPPMKAWLREASSPGELLARLRAEGVSVLVVTPGWGGGTAQSLLPLATSAGEARLLEELRRSLELVGSYDGVDVLRVSEE